MRTLARQFAGLWLAWQFREQAGLTEVEVQARLLAGQPFVAVAAQAGLPIEVLEAYQSTFFHIVDDRQARDWLEFEAVSKGHRVPEDLAVRVVLLKRLALVGGPLVVDAVLPILLRTQAPRVKAAGGDRSSAMGGVEQQLEALLRLETAPVDEKLTLNLVREALLRPASPQKPLSTSTWSEFQQEKVLANPAGSSVEMLAPPRPDTLTASAEDKKRKRG